MTIKTRLAKLEGNKGNEPLIVLFKTFYETADGSDEDETGMAAIIWGLGRTDLVVRASGEPSVAWQARLEALASIGPVKA